MENVSGGGRLAARSSFLYSASVFGPQPAEGTAEPSGEEGSPPPGVAAGCRLYEPGNNK